MVPSSRRVACLVLFAVGLVCTVSGQDEDILAADGQEATARLTRKLLSSHWEDLGCHCSHEAHMAGDCPCHPDTTWLKNGECPSCPVYACGDCDPLKCDECKRCCDGTVLSDDRKTCSCPSCEITGCLECDATDCSKCLVCAQGYRLTADRKCDWRVCPVPYCEKCDVLNRYQCEVCYPPLELTNDRKSCGCPECAIAGCVKCDPEKCDECLECEGNLVPSYDKKSCPGDSCICEIPNCFECEEDCDTCRLCNIGYELVDYNTKCKTTVCNVDYCAECCIYNSDRCMKCLPPYVLKNYPEGGVDGLGYPLDPCTGFKPADECVCDPAKCTVPYCAVCGGDNCTSCEECDVGYKKQPDGSCGVETCYAPGCKECCKDDPHQCSDCLHGYSIAGADYGQCGQCVCDPCNAPYCKTCSPDNCKECNECKDGYVPDYNGECICDTSYSTVAHCHTYNRTDCGKCQICDKDYMWNGTHCVCDRPEVEHCATYSAEDCKVCIVCEKGLVPSKDGTKCVCDPANCNVDYCKTCDPDTCSGYSPTCLVCEKGLVASSDGLTCECPYCAVDGCKKCAPPDCQTCVPDECKPPAVLGYDQKCSCPYCNIDDCDECDPEDCDKLCKTCKPPKVSDGAGGCVCPKVNIPNCEVYNSETCLCDECKVRFDLADGGKSCKCNCDANVGCAHCAPDTCLCDECEDDLIKSCGYCFGGQTVPGCAWGLIESRNGESCDKICSYSSRFTVPVISTCSTDAYADTMYKPPSYVCTVDLKGKEALRPGENLPSNDTGYCYAEFHTGPEPIEGQEAKRKGSAAFNCLCQTPDKPLQWVPKYETHGEDNRLHFGEGCNKICAKKNLKPLSVQGNHIYGDCHTMSPFYICRVQGQGSGYNIDQLSPPQARVWNGFCMTPRMASEDYDCLCGGECHYPDCGVDTGYAPPYADGEMMVA